MENLDRRSGVIPFVEAQKRIPSAESDHAVTLLERHREDKTFPSCASDRADASYAG
jgi:hypothetical protein